MTELNIDDELRELIAPLSTDEYATLEASILEEGIREPIIVWEQGNVILDGHNRYEIATRHGFDMSVIPYTVKSIFRDRSEAMVWMIDNQRGRRNLSRQQLLELGFKRAELLRPKAEENRLANLKQNQDDTESANWHPRESADAISNAAEFAGVSRRTAARYKRVMTDAPEEVRQEVKSGKTSINKAYQAVRPKKEPEPVETDFWEPEEEQEDAQERVRQSELGRHESIVLKTYEVVMQRLSAIGDLGDRQNAIRDLADRLTKWAEGISGGEDEEDA